MCKHTACHMRWHKEKCVDTEGILRHPADSEAWKDFDKQNLEFALNSRNVRLGLTIDGLKTPSLYLYLIHFISFIFLFFHSFIL